GGDDAAVVVDGEGGVHRAGQRRLDDELLLVAVLDLVQLLAHVAADGVLVEAADRRRVADGHPRLLGGSAAHAAPAPARAVARAHARAVAAGAVTTGADGAHAGAAAARAHARDPVAPAAGHLARLVADEAALDVAVVEAGGEVAGRRQRGEGAALLRLDDAE